MFKSKPSKKSTPMVLLVFNQKPPSSIIDKFLKNFDNQKQKNSYLATLILFLP